MFRPIIILIIFLARRLVVGFVLELVKSTRLHGLQSLLVIVDIRDGLLPWLFHNFILVFIHLFVLVFLCRFDRASTVFRAWDRDAFGFEGAFNSRKLLDEGRELLDVERDSLESLLVAATRVVRTPFD